MGARRHVASTPLDRELAHIAGSGLCARPPSPGPAGVNTVTRHGRRPHHPRDAQPVQRFPRLPRRERGGPGGRGGHRARPRRPQRGREDDPVQPAHRFPPAHRRRHPLRRDRHHPPAPRAHRAPGRREVLPSDQPLRADGGARARGAGVAGAFAGEGGPPLLAQ
ncbi:hypothetical protein SBRY_10891 [Actinacidiphila bryophytorum]|uniref:Uncharacterized protein n=1 Tax=Actinacidiphila bryophytorum TaxID=1436133 RepID=A0A9W4GX96_9ACTN|nr:hypothetical protein SBRY_10891 [Actinacidiphila bryophytorum]